jgi:hypothetical protein
MFKRKTKPAASPERAISRLYSEVLNEHRYERLEMDVSWTCLPALRSLPEFIALMPMPWEQRNFPLLLEGFFHDMPVYLDKELPDGTVEIRGENCDVLATTMLSREAAP